MRSAYIKIFLFLLCTIAFVSGLIAYSDSRGNDLHSSANNGEEYSGYADNARRFEKQFSVSNGGKLVVEADAGTVSITSWDKKEVSVIVEIEGSDSRADKYTVDFQQDGNTVKVTGKVRDKSIFKWHIGNLEARYTIVVPQEFNTSVNTSGGDIDAKDLIGKMNYETSGGDVTVEKIKGETYLSTSGGNIDARNITGNLDAETSGGDVRCENVIGDVNGNTSGGNVEFRSVDGRVKSETSGGDITIKLKGENKGIEASTSGGSIYIYLSDKVKATIDAETTGGSVDCDFPVTVKGKVRDSELHGTINGGGNVIRASTSGGSIKISQIK